jgi:hypothetical protein
MLFLKQVIWRVLAEGVILRRGWQPPPGPVARSALRLSQPHRAFATGGPVVRFHCRRLGARSARPISRPAATVACGRRLVCRGRRARFHGSQSPLLGCRAAVGCHSGASFAQQRSWPSRRPTKGLSAYIRTPGGQTVEVAAQRHAGYLAGEPQPALDSPPPCRAAGSLCGTGWGDRACLYGQTLLLGADDGR